MNNCTVLTRRALRYELLGPLALRVGDEDVAPTAPRLRAVLSLLALNANRVVSTGLFLRELWGAAPSASARTTLQGYIFHLRKLLERELKASARQVANEVLVTHADGYLLRVAPGQLDVRDFEALVERGNLALAAGDNAEAIEALDQALALWRGPIGGDWSLGACTQANVARLDELRLLAVVLSVEANLCLGRHREIVGELASLLVEHPCQQMLNALFMVALHRSDRTSGALAAYRRLAKQLRDELGMEPSARLQALHRALLIADPVLDKRELRVDALLDTLTEKWPSPRPTNTWSRIDGERDNLRFDRGRRPDRPVRGAVPEPARDFHLPGGEAHGDDGPDQGVRYQPSDDGAAAKRRARTDGGGPRAEARRG